MINELRRKTVQNRETQTATNLPLNTELGLAFRTEWGSKSSLTVSNRFHWSRSDHYTNLLLFGASEARDGEVGLSLGNVWVEKSLVQGAEWAQLGRNRWVKECDLTQQYLNWFNEINLVVCWPGNCSAFCSLLGQRECWIGPTIVWRFLEWNERHLRYESHAFSFSRILGGGGGV